MLQLKVIQIIPETEDVKTYLLQNIDNQRISYKAGQFLTLIFNIDGQETRRSYSLNSAPNVDASFAISVKRIPNGAVSRYFHDHVHVGDSVQSLLPSGRFVVSDKDIADRTKIYFFVAAGSGLYKTTLLQAALDNGIALPFSCKGGACTTCICKTTRGKVVMPANYKIFDAEILRGVTLSCIAYADSEAVEIVVN